MVNIDPGVSGAAVRLLHRGGMKRTRLTAEATTMNMNDTGGSDSQLWALAVAMLARFNGSIDASLIGASLSALDDARLAVERTSRNEMLSGGPKEVFSQRVPVYYPPPGEDRDLVPIDVLLGQYVPKDLLVEIFIKSIEKYSVQLGIERTDLLTIVRLHEYAHAVVHTGIELVEIEKQLGTLGAGGETDWASFRANRDTSFSALDEASHELLAQAITWACLCKLPPTVETERLKDAFLTLEKRQVKEYRLQQEVKLKAQATHWPVVLEAARGEPDAHRDPGFCLAEGLAALVMLLAQPSG